MTHLLTSIQDSYGSGTLLPWQCSSSERYTNYLLFLTPCLERGSRSHPEGTKICFLFLRKEVLAFVWHRSLSRSWASSPLGQLLCSDAPVEGILSTRVPRMHSLYPTLAVSIVLFLENMSFSMACGLLFKVIGSVGQGKATRQARLGVGLLGNSTVALESTRPRSAKGLKL